MSHILGVHWMSYHLEAADFQHMAKMQYRSATIFEWMWNNGDFCRNLISALPRDAVIVCRWHGLSEEWGPFKAQPATTGRRHADEWAQKVRSGQVHTPLDRTLFLGLNEPDSNHYQRHIDQYNEAFCRRMTEHGLRACAYSFGVGHPSTVNLQPSANPDWSWYAASAAAVLEGGHWVAMHEYGAPASYGWGFWCDRLMYCPYPFTVIIQEAGIDGGVVDEPKKGYLSYMHPAQYVPWLDGYMARMRQGNRKSRVHSIQPFTYDSNTDWHSFDIRPARAELERYNWTQVSQPQPPSPPQPKPPVITPPAGDNWQRSLAWVEKWEGEYQNHPQDIGNWTGCAVGVGINKGTKYGISACSYPHVDIVNLTREQAREIYRRDYWIKSGADKLAWPLCLLVLDTAVLHGVGAATTWLKEVGPNPYAFAAKRLRVYTGSKNWVHFGRGWVNRTSELLEMMGK